ncbi:hypothetical protein EVG20_g10045 [Dentipellis fragilis]|uniref:Uncharacterized protein n=1 Tax=Dentipellis fragilis TaxID=205917 RepID=A0A4Y9XU68_9AGAM|nr:hypothetical protein EVG20_g10045 [Dentipellis fragilis]
MDARLARLNASGMRTRARLTKVLADLNETRMLVAECKVQLAESNARLAKSNAKLDESNAKFAESKAELAEDHAMLNEIKMAFAHLTLGEENTSPAAMPIRARSCSV